MEHPEEGTLVGQSIGNYRVLQRIGAGAMGEVYLGEHPRIGRRVAIKVLIAQLSASPEISQRFISEAKAVNTINHPNIIQIFDFGDLPDGRLYFTMEYLQGRDLTEHIEKRAPLPLSEVLSLTEQITAALDAAHETGIIHRDLKPDNIFVADSRKGPVVKVLDFGIAKLAEPGLGSAVQTSSGIIMGTPLYMSPEQAAGRTRDVSPKSDIYALGVILYHMLSGRLPIEAPTTAELLYKHMHEPPVPLTQVASGLPTAVQDVVLRCLAKSPDDRPASAGRVLQELQEACLGNSASLEALAATQMPVDDLAATAAGKASTLGGAAAQAMAPVAPSEREKHGRPKGLYIGVGAAAAVALAAVIFVLAGGIPGEKPNQTKTPDADMSAPASPASPADSMAQHLPPERPTPRAVPTDALKIHLIRVKSKSRRTRVDVRIGGRSVFTNRAPPFELKVKQGERITLVAKGRGREEKTESWIAVSSRAVVLNLKRHRGRRRPMAVAVRPRAYMRPRPRVRPRPRPRIRPRTRPRTSVGVETLQPMF